MADCKKEMKKSIIFLMICICLAETTASYAANAVKQDGAQTAQLAIEEGQEPTLKLQDEFKQFINELYEDNKLSAENDCVTITKDKYYSDTYIEGGNVPHTGRWGTRTLFCIAQIPTTSGSDGNLYDIQGIHIVYPYAWTMYATT